jgi:hypothetical protein
MGQIITYLRNRAQSLKLIFFGFLIFTIVYDIFAERHEPHFWGDNIIGFWALFGGLGCLVMSVVCKGLYKNWLKKDDNYYDK